MTQLIKPYKGIFPKISSQAFIAENAAIIGDVTIGEHSNIWYSVTIRGDVNFIRIGNNVNIQDNSVVHVTQNTHPTHIGNNVTIGHLALIHGCTLEDSSFVGMHSTVMDGAVVQTHGMLAAGSLLTPNKTIPSGQLWAGSPARYMRDLTEDEISFISISSQNYVETSKHHILLSENL